MTAETTPPKYDHWRAVTVLPAGIRIPVPIKPPPSTMRALYGGWWRLFLLALLPWLAACAGATPTPYRPPTLVAQSSPPSQPSATPAEVLPTPLSAAPPCTNDLTFVQDLTIPDGTLVSPGAQLDKRWKVQNSGGCNWDEGYQLRLVSGPELGALPEQALYPARSGAEATFRILFTAPTEPGIYQSAWQAHDPQGNPFGDLFFIYIEVESPPAP